MAKEIMRRWETGLALGLLCGLCLAAAVARAATTACEGIPTGTTTDFSAGGNYPVGVRTYTFVDASRPTMPSGSYPGAPDRTLVTEVWYPAQSAGRNATFEPSGAPYPVVVHSHGFLDNRLGEQYLTAHLASRGYIVAAPDYPLSNGGMGDNATVADVGNQPGDWSFVLDRILAEFGTNADSTHIGASGLSLGGLTTYLVTFHRDLRDSRVTAAAPLAGPGCMFTRTFFQTTDAPLLVVFGDSDQIVSYRQNGRAGYARARTPKALIRLIDGSHTGFTEFALYFDPGIHYDVLGCWALTGGGDQSDPNSDPFGSLADEEVGVRSGSARCPRPCRKPVPTKPSMAATRHHELTKASVAAFFDAYLKDDTGARCFLARQFNEENRDIRVRSQGLD